MGVVATGNVKGLMAKNAMGKFIGECEAAATKTAWRIGEEGAALAKAGAPVRSGDMKKSIENVTVGRAGRWSVGTDHWHFIEYGTRAHQIVGRLRFEWSGGTFVWSDPKYRNFNHVFDPTTRKSNAAWVWHPGNEATPFMHASYVAMKPRVIQIAKEEYPG